MIPRHMLPQIPGDQLDEFREFLEGNGIKTTLKKLPANRLKPIQSEVNREKVDSFKANPEKLAQPIVISKGGFVLDGHHRWLAQKELDPTAKMVCIVCDCSIRQLVEMGHSFEGSFTKSVSEIRQFNYLRV
jgi:hypothetical protein